VSNYWWLREAPNFPSLFTEAIHYAQTFWLIDALKNQDYAFFLHCLRNVELYEPSYYLLPLFLRFLGFHSYCFDVLLNLIYFFFLLLSLASLARRLFDEKTALLAILCVSLYPGIYGMSRHFYVDFGLLWIMTLSMYLILKTEYLQSRKYSLLAGCAIGIGLMTKMPFVLFVFPFLSVYIGCALYAERKKSEKKELRHVLRNVFFLLLVSSCIAGYRYFRSTVFHFGIMTYCAEPGNDSVLYYVFGLARSMMSEPFFLIVLCAFGWLYTRANTHLKVFFSLWFIPAFLYLSTMSHFKEIRYILPLLPCCALLSGAFLASIKNKKVFVCIVSALLIFGLFQFGMITFLGNYKNGDQRVNTFTSYDNDLFFRFSENNNFCAHLLKIFSKYYDHMSPRLKVLILPSHSFSERFSWYYSTAIWEIINRAKTSPLHFERGNINPKDLTLIVPQILESDFFVSGRDLSTVDAQDEYVHIIINQARNDVQVHPDVYTDFTAYEVMDESDDAEAFRRQFRAALAIFDLIEHDTFRGEDIFIYKKKTLS
jgi:hypothetical protein